MVLFEVCRSSWARPQFIRPEGSAPSAVWQHAPCLSKIAARQMALSGTLRSLLDRHSGRSVVDHKAQTIIVVQVPTGLPNLVSDRPHLPIANRHAIKLCNRHDATRPAGHEDLIALTDNLLDYAWVAPSRVRYSGGSLASVVNYLKSADALTVMPHRVVFPGRKERTMTALPINIPQPERALAILRRVNRPRSPPVKQFWTFIRSSFDGLKHLIKRHEEAVVWDN